MRIKKFFKIHKYIPQLWKGKNDITQDIGLDAEVISKETMERILIKEEREAQELPKMNRRNWIERELKVSPHTNKAQLNPKKIPQQSFPLFDIYSSYHLSS